MANNGIFDILAKIVNLGKNEGYDRLRILFFLSEIILLAYFITVPINTQKFIGPILNFHTLGFISKEITIGMIIAVFVIIGLIGRWMKRI